MTDTSSLSVALIDNWLLEYAIRLIEGNHTGKWEEISRNLESAQVGSSYVSLKLAKREGWRFPYILRLMTDSLLNFIDIALLNDKILYDYEYSHGWDKTASAKVLAPLLQPLKFDARTRAQLTNKTNSSKWATELPTTIFDLARLKTYNATVAHGAVYYLELSSYLGVPYWPSPIRSLYLRDQLSLDTSRFVHLLTGKVSDELNRFYEEVVSSKYLNNSSLLMPSFGGMVLEHCKNRNDIFPELMRLRETPPFQAFRLWAQSMDIALEKGDLLEIAQGLNEVHKIISMLRDSVSGDTLEYSLDIGLTPVLTINQDFVDKFIQKIRPKPLHIVFLRNYISFTARNLKFSRLIEQLIPGIRDSLDKESIFQVDTFVDPYIDYDNH